MKVDIVRPTRSGRQYRAFLSVNGSEVGVVERGWNQGGYRADDYVARIGRWKLAAGRTLADLRHELRDPAVQDEIADLVAERADER